MSQIHHDRDDAAATHELGRNLQTGHSCLPLGDNAPVGVVSGIPAEVVRDDADTCSLQTKTGHVLVSHMPQVQAWGLGVRLGVLLLGVAKAGFVKRGSLDVDSV